MCRSFDIYWSCSHFWVRRVERCDNDIEGYCTVKHQDPPHERLGTCPKCLPLVSKAPLTPDRVEKFQAKQRAARLVDEQATMQAQPARQAQVARQVQAETKAETPSQTQAEMQAEAARQVEALMEVDIDSDAEEDWVETKKAAEARWASDVDHIAMVQAKAPKRTQTLRPAKESRQTQKAREADEQAEVDRLAEAWKEMERQQRRQTWKTPKAREAVKPYRVTGGRRLAGTSREAETDNATRENRKTEVQVRAELRQRLERARHRLAEEEALTQKIAADVAERIGARPVDYPWAAKLRPGVQDKAVPEHSETTGAHLQMRDKVEEQSTQEGTEAANILLQIRHGWNRP